MCFKSERLLQPLNRLYLHNLTVGNINIDIYRVIFWDLGGHVRATMSLTPTSPDSYLLALNPYSCDYVKSGRNILTTATPLLLSWMQPTRHGFPRRRKSCVSAGGSVGDYYLCCDRKPSPSTSTYTCTCRSPHYRHRLFESQTAS